MKPPVISKTLAAMVCVTMLATATGLAPQGEPPPTRTKIGAKAPDFALTDTKGQKRRLSDYKERIVILEWINPECPFVGRLYRSGAMQETHRKVRELDKSVVWLAINSTHTTGAKQNDYWITTHKLKYPILLDADGAVGRLFDARRTPHMFVIDAKGILRYQGAIDDNRLGSKDKGQVTNYVLNAVGQILEEQPVAPDYVKPYGCVIKYRR